MFFPTCPDRSLQKRLPREPPAQINLPDARWNTSSPLLHLLVSSSAFLLSSLPLIHLSSPAPPPLPPHHHHSSSPTAPRSLFQLLDGGDGLHCDVQSPEYPFSWPISPQQGPARKEQHASANCRTQFPTHSSLKTHYALHSRSRRALSR